MSVHRSLAKKGLGEQHRNVKKKFERVRIGIESGESVESPFGLPKIRSIKVKKK